MKSTIFTTIALATLASASAIPGTHHHPPELNQDKGYFYGAVKKGDKIGPRLGTVAYDTNHASDFGQCINMVEAVKGKGNVPSQALTMRALTGVTCVFFE
jgi:hypothetical protein